MSLPALALLITATGALREAVTAAGANGWVRVEMEPGDPIAIADSLSAGVLVCVYTGDEAHKLIARRWFEGDRTVELAVQCILSPAVAATFGAATVNLDPHKAGAEPIFAAVDRLIELAFTCGAPGSWGELLKDMITTVPADRHKLPFLAATKNGVEIPACDFSIPVHTINSPPPGDVEVQTQGFWPALVAKMRDTPSAAPLADFVEALVKGRLLDLWQVEQALAGVGPVDGAAVGVGALDGVHATPPGTVWTIETGAGRAPLRVEAEDLAP